MLYERVSETVPWLIDDPYILYLSITPTVAVYSWGVLLMVGLYCYDTDISVISYIYLYFGYIGLNIGLF